MDTIIPMSLTIFFLYPIFSQAQSTEFWFNGFSNRNSELALDSASIIEPTGELRLTNTAKNAIGHAFYSKPIQMFNASTSSSSSSNSFRNATSFSTSFVFQIITPEATTAGYGLAFVLAPSTKFPGAAAGHYLGLFNSSNNGHPSNHIFAVEFDTVKGFNETADEVGNHVGINVNGMESEKSTAASYYFDKNKSEAVNMGNGDPVEAWIEYDGVNKLVNVTICPMGKGKPIEPLISYPVDLSSNVDEFMYVGFSASTGNKSSFHYVLGWSFSMNEAAPPLNLAQLPIAKIDGQSSSFQPSVIGLIAALCAVTALLLGSLIFLTVYNKMALIETLEDWELECPHRFRYKDLHAATKGFKESEIIGVGGFGVVYKALLPATGHEVAVKKITRNSVQGLREFVAEIESLGRLRHKNLVNLQGWCKYKSALLLVYDYIPNGSLYSLLFHPENGVVLSWEQRFNILKGVASGLLYLHEDWEQVVIHRDVKPSNVLVDAEMNGRLGDFGLARLYDHGASSHTTNIVGTIGYIAPELLQTTRASTSSDVYAYGVLLLEVASGRRAIDSDHFVLVDWVIECQQMGRILDAADRTLDSRYPVEEMELVLWLGLLCSHQKPQARPSMRQVLRYLNRDDKLPTVGDWGSIDLRGIAEMNSRLTEVISGNIVSSSNYSSSMGAMSANSLDAGR